MGLLGGLVVANMGALFAGTGDEPLPETLRRAVREARYQAAFTKQPVYLSYDKEKATLVITGSNGSALATFKADATPERDGIVFYQILPEQGIRSPQRGQFAQLERAPTQVIAFAPNRSSTPFIAEVTYAGEKSTHRFDPFSNLQIVEAKR